MFYGLEIKDGQTKTIQFQNSNQELILTQITLVQGSKVNILLNQVSIATLNENTPQIHINYKIQQTNNKINVQVSGKGIVHLCGYFLVMDEKEQIAIAPSVAQLLKQNNQQQVLITQDTKINNKQELQKKWDEYDWEDQKFQERVK